MTKTITNIKKVALIFFILAGVTHLGSSILLANELFPNEASLVNKTTDAPLILTGLLYGFASLRLSLTSPEKDHKILDMTLGAVVLIVLLGIIVINLGFPNLK